MIVLAYTLLLLAGVCVGFIAGYSLRGRNQRKSERAAEQELRLKEFSRLMQEVREAHYRGDIGLADTLSQAAAHVLEETT